MFDLQPAKLLLMLHFPELLRLFRNPFAFTPARTPDAFADLAPQTLDVPLLKRFLTPGAAWSARCLYGNSQRGSAKTFLILFPSQSFPRAAEDAALPGTVSGRSGAPQPEERSAQSRSHGIKWHRLQPGVLGPRGAIEGAGLG